MRHTFGRRLFRVRRFPKGFLSFSILVVFLLILVRILSERVDPIIKTVAESKAVNCIALAISEEADNCLEENQLSYHDFVLLEAGENGRVTTLSFQSNVGVGFKRQLTEKLVNRLENMDSDVLSIPLGTLTDLIFFSSVGPNIRVRVQSIGDIQTEYRNEFVTSGVNQTKHSVYLDVAVTVYLLLPGDIITVTSEESVCVAETIIVGEVPETYLNLQNGASADG